MCAQALEQEAWSKFKAMQFEAREGDMVDGKLGKNVGDIQAR